jgi:hypothetical protein
MGSSGEVNLEKENVSQQKQKMDLLHPEHGTTIEKKPFFPSTPAGRVPTFDLIKDGEEFTDQTPRRSPLEAVSWNRSPKSSAEQQSFATPVMRRNKKRRRSISPNRSSQRATLTKPTFDFQIIQDSLKTPQNDPASALESRYFARSKLQTPSKPSSSAAPDFMHSSSPQTPALSAVDTGKLKRTMSCGIAYPPEKKRRKNVDDTVEVKRGQLRGRAGRDRDGEIQEINTMLDSIHDELPILSGSQLSEITSSYAPPDNDPIIGRESQRARKAITISSRQSQTGSQELQASLKASQTSQVLSATETSDYGDKEFDAELAQIPVENLIGSSNHHDEQDNDALGAPQPARIAKNLNDIMKDKDDDDNDDEFDDGFDDDCVADLEMIASMYDEKPVASKGDAFPASLKTINEPPISLPIDEGLSARHNPGITTIEVSDDEFDEGIDDEFCDELFKATQACEDPPVRFSH